MRYPMQAVRHRQQLAALLLAAALVLPASVDPSPAELQVCVRVCMCV